MKKTRFLLLSIASIAPLITISSIGCFVSDKEYKQYLKNLKVIDDFEITRPVIKIVNETNIIVVIMHLKLD